VRRGRSNDQCLVSVEVNAGSRGLYAINIRRVVRVGCSCHGKTDDGVRASIFKPGKQWAQQGQTVRVNWDERVRLSRYYW
jgi:hypothetical protein